VLLEVESLRLLVKEEDVSMRGAARRWSWTDVVRHKGLARVKGRRIGDLDAGLDPVQDRSQSTERWERCIDVETHDEVRLGGIRSVKRQVWGRLSSWNSSGLALSRGREIRT
jgi:hypothetical protein